MLTLDEVCARALALPCSPALLPRLSAMMADPHTEIDDLANVIQLDPVLASSTLRLANSAYFAGSGAVETVSQAIMRMGAKELYRLVALSLASRWMAIEVKGYSWEAGDFCRASLVKALGAESLAQRTRLVDPALAYTCGLIHEIGKLAIAFSCGEAFSAIRQHCASEGSTWLTAEKAELGFNHADVSARLLTEWRFPEACISVALHNPPSAAIPAEHRSLAAHVHAADHMAAALGVGQGEDGFLYRLDTELLAESGITAETMEATLPTVFERATLLLKGGLNTGKIAF